MMYYREERWNLLVTRLVDEAERTLRYGRRAQFSSVTVHIVINYRMQPVVWVVHPGTVLDIVTDQRVSWSKFVHGCRDEAREVLGNSRDGLSIITGRLTITATKQLVSASIPNGLRIEPTRDAKEVLSLLTGNS